MQNVECGQCGTVFQEQDAITVTDMQEEMYDRGLSPVAILACPKCESTDVLWDTSKEVTY